MNGLLYKMSLKYFRIWLFFLVGIIVPTSAMASYANGFWGLIILVYSFKIAIFATLVTFIFVYLGLFRSKRFLYMYFSVFLISAFIALILTTRANDPVSFFYVLIGEPILLPAYIQYKRANKS